ncbi:hypothetical protein ACSLPA_33145, partial [Escherichia coli]
MQPRISHTHAPEVPGAALLLPVLPSAHRVDITADTVPEQLMPVVFSREGNSRTLNLLLCKGPE